MLGKLEAPPCHWKACSWFGRPMKLLNEGEAFWFFACECGCTRAVSKPSTREKSYHDKYQRDVEEIKRRQRILSSRPEFSIPGGG